MTPEYKLKQFLAAREHPRMERHLTWLGAIAIADGVIGDQSHDVVRFPDVSAGRPAGEGRSGHHAGVGRSARAVPRSRGDGARAARSLASQGAWPHHQGDIKGSSAWSRSG